MSEVYLIADIQLFYHNGSYTGPLAFFVKKDGLAERVKKIMGDVEVTGPKDPSSTDLEPSQLNNGNAKAGTYLIGNESFKSAITLFPEKWDGLPSGYRALRFWVNADGQSKRIYQALFDISALFEEDAKVVSEVLGVTAKVRPVFEGDKPPIVILNSKNVQLYNRYAGKEIGGVRLGVYPAESFDDAALREYKFGLKRTKE